MRLASAKENGNMPEKNDDYDRLKKQHIAEFNLFGVKKVIANIERYVAEMTHTTLSPLVTVRNDEEAERHWHFFYEHFPDMIYIDKPADLYRLWEPFYIEDNVRKKRDKGPLKQAILEGKILVIRWDHFSPREIATYKSLIDAEPSLLGSPVHNNLKVIGLICSHTHVSSAFTSRCQLVSLTLEESKEESLEEQS